MTPTDVLAEAVLLCKMLTGRYLAGFSDQSATAQPPGLPNHVAWNLGHCAHTMHRVAQNLDGKPPPISDFAPGSPSAFNPESIAFGSKPAADPKAYPSLARCTEIYNAACDRLATLVRTASESQLNQPVKWGGADHPLWAIILRMPFHNGFHTGQIADLRRNLGLKSIFS